METSWVTGIGLIAGLCTTSSFLPQIIKTIRSKKTRDLSTGMYLTLSLGLFLWFVYGIFLRDIPLIITNGISFSFSAMVLFFKFRHG